MQSKQVSVWIFALTVATWALGCNSDGAGNRTTSPIEDILIDDADVGETSGGTNDTSSGTSSGGDVVILPDGQTCTTDCSAGCGLDDGCGGVCGCTIGFDCENNFCIENSVTCIKIDKSSHVLYPPAGLRVVFRVTDCDGYPVRKLTQQDVQIINDAKGEPFGAGGEGGGASAPSTPSEYGLYSMLVLDMSDSIFNAGAVDQVLDGARLFVQRAVDQAPAGLKQNVGIMVFGRTAGTRVVQDFTADHALLYQQIDALRSGQSLGTTNLYGAYTTAIQQGLAEGTGLELAERAVVILTDGTHEAGDEENLRTQALSAKQSGESGGSLTVFSIGIRGNYDESKIRELASRPEYFRIAQDASALSTIFDEFATRTKAIAESNYAVGVCTPIELGTASLTVQVQVSGASTEKQVSYNADEPGHDLTGDIESCDPGLIADPCDERVCGAGALPGSQCGTCPSASDICTTEGQCQDDCVGRACGISATLGLSCGTCSGATVCSSNQCVTAPAAGTQQIFGTGGASAAYRFIRPGAFTMGSPEDEEGRSSEEIQHSVTLTRGFWLKETEVTQGEWQAVMGNNPSYFNSCGATCPVEKVSWWDAVAYCNELSTIQSLTTCYTLSGCIGTPGVEGYECSDVTQNASCTGYRLPTEAEWEYAYRADTTTAFYNGPITKILGLDPNLELIGWYIENSSFDTQLVAGKAANTWGLYDMPGNVWEWVWDRYGDYASTPQSDPSGPLSGDSRVLRGGAWSTYGQGCRAAQRYSYSPIFRPYDVGFRPARSF